CYPCCYRPPLLDHSTEHLLTGPGLKSALCGCLLSLDPIWPRPASHDWRRLRYRNDSRYCDSGCLLDCRANFSFSEAHEVAEQGNLMKPTCAAHYISQIFPVFHWPCLNCMQFCYSKSCIMAKSMV